ncbi:MAG: response regulator transcription factor [Mycobacteriales bacterium]
MLEDHLLTREGIVRTLEHVGVEVVAAVTEVPAFLRAVALEAPDAVVADVRLPPTFTDEGLRAVKDVKRLYPGVGALVLSQYVEAEFAMGLLEQVSGGVGYLLKDRVLDPETLMDSLRRVVAGQCVLDPSLVADLLRPRRVPEPLATLTEREVEVLQGIAEGFTNSAIGQRLFISERTVEVHAQRIFAKLGVTEDPQVNRRVLAAVKYLLAPPWPDGPSSPR